MAAAEHGRRHDHETTVDHALMRGLVTAGPVMRRLWFWRAARYTPTGPSRKTAHSATEVVRVDPERRTDQGAGNSSVLLTMW